jgi:conjugative transfer signal peptidase TraF
MTSLARKRMVTWGFPFAMLFTLLWRCLPLTINWSPSVPIGVYWLTTNPHAPYLTFCMSRELLAEAESHGYESLSGHCPNGKAWILKPNLEHAQEVTFSQRGFVIDHRLFPNTAPLEKDRRGRTLPHYPFGTYRASGKEVWVVSRYNQRSYDSRYFGPVSRSSIVSYARPLLVFP